MWSLMPQFIATGRKRHRKLYYTTDALRTHRHDVAGNVPVSARIPNLPQIVGGAFVGPGGVDELGEIVARAPVEVELGARIVEPVGMIGAGYVDRA
jgi:hypothetical protein